MLIIHQRKSAGTSLIFTLSKILGVGIDSERKISIFNSRGKRLHNYLKSFVDVESPIKSVHLHPTESNFKWIDESRIKCVVLLRTPSAAWEALARHREIDNSSKRVNNAFNYEKSKEIMNEFYANWDLLSNRDHICMIKFEDLIENPKEAMAKILNFYEVERPFEDLNFAKKRYSGKKRNQDEIKFIRKSDEPTFNFDPDYRPKSIFKRVIGRLIRLVRSPKY